jgi:hypothetical protein
MSHRTVMQTSRRIALLIVAALALASAGCASSREEAPPPPPIDPAAFSGPARPPAPAVDVSADLDAGDILDATPVPATTATVSDAGRDAQPARRTR